MTASSSYTVAPLTESGVGGWLTGDVTAEAIGETAMRTGAALVKGVKFDETSFRDFVGSLGDTVSYEQDDADVGYGFTDVLHLDGTRESGKGITGRGPLPLHTDGVLLGTQVDLIILYAAEVRDLQDDGATLVCDQITAWREMDADLRSVMLRGTLEYRALERGYFSTVPDGWYSIPVFRDYGRVKSLNLALPFAPGVPASWEVRVPGAGESESAQVFAALRDHLSAKRYLYVHRWEAGDLVVIDNQRTLHGRRGLADSASRKLLRGQVTLAPVAGAPGATSQAY